jgi:hypothetical protein
MGLILDQGEQPSSPHLFTLPPNQPWRFLRQVRVASQEHAGGGGQEARMIPRMGVWRLPAIGSPEQVMCEGPRESSQGDPDGLRTAAIDPPPSSRNPENLCEGH